MPRFYRCYNNLNKLVTFITKSILIKKTKIFVKVPHKNYLNKFHLKNKNIVEIGKIRDLSKFLKKLTLQHSTEIFLASWDIYKSHVFMSLMNQRK